MRVLIVDDAENIRYSLSMMLKFEGFECQAVADNDQALFAISNVQATGRPFDVALLDLCLPGTTTAHLVSHLRSLAQSERPQIVLFSASSDLASEAEHLGADSMIAKPFTMDHLVTEIRRLENPKRNLTEAYADSTSSHPSL